METLTNKGVSCFLHKSNKYRGYYVKKDKNVCWRCTNKAFNARIETRDGTVVEEFLVSLSRCDDSIGQRDCSTHGVQEKSVRTRRGAPYEDITYCAAGNEYGRRGRGNISIYSQFSGGYIS